MISLGGYPLTIGVEHPLAPFWIMPLLDLGKDAAFIDTGYLRALLDNHDTRHSETRRHFDSTKALIYTSPLVAGEVCRQLAKYKAPHVDQQWRWDRIKATKGIIVDQRRIFVCDPSREVLGRAILELEECQYNVVGLDLCDMLSAVMLDLLKHRRVLGYDEDLATFGASLEP